MSSVAGKRTCAICYRFIRSHLYRHWDKAHPWWPKFYDKPIYLEENAGKYIYFINAKDVIALKYRINFSPKFT